MEVLVVVPKVSQMTNIIYMVDSVDMRELIAVPAQRERASERAVHRKENVFAMFLIVLLIRLSVFFNIATLTAIEFPIILLRSTVFLKIMGNF